MVNISIAIMQFNYHNAPAFLQNTSISSLSHISKCVENHLR